MTSSPATTDLDEITASLFSQLRDRYCICDFDILQCPKCPERLQALELDVFKENGQTFQRIWWTCRGCNFPLRVPPDVFWTRRTEEQMKTGYLPLPNIHLMPPRLWHLYPNIFGDKLKEKDTEHIEKDDSVADALVLNDIARERSLEPEGVLTKGEECSQVFLLSVPSPSTETNTNVLSNAQVLESEMPIRQIMIDEDLEDNFESANKTGVDWKSKCFSQEINMSRNIDKTEARVLMSNYLKLRKSKQNLPDCTDATESFPVFPGYFSSTVKESQVRQHFKGGDSHELNADNGEVLETHFLNNDVQINQNMKETGLVPSTASDLQVPGKRSQRSVSDEDNYEVVTIDIAEKRNGSVSPLSSQTPPKVMKSKRVVDIHDSFSSEKQQKGNAEDERVVASLINELQLRVALNLGENGNSVPSTDEIAMETFSVESAKERFGNLTPDESMKSVSNMELPMSSSILVQKRPELSDNDFQLFDLTDFYHSENTHSEKCANICTKFATHLNTKFLRKQRSNNKRSFSKHIPTDEKCIAVVENALKESINNKEANLPPRVLVLKGSPTEFRPEMIPDDIFDPLNWRRPVHLGGHTNLDAFVTAYNLRYNRVKYLDALASELCKRKIMMFVPSIPVKQQRLVRRMQQKQLGQEDTVDLEALKKAVDPNALRLQIAHRLGIKEIDSMIAKTKDSGINDEENTSQMQHIGSAHLNILQEAIVSNPTDSINCKEHVDQLSTPSTSESLHFFPRSSFDHKLNVEKEHTPYNQSCNDSEIEALVHRKLQHFSHDESGVETAIEQYPSSLTNQSDSSGHLELATPRIDYTDFENAFEEYEDDVPHLDPMFDTHFDQHSF